MENIILAIKKTSYMRFKMEEPDSNYPAQLRVRTFRHIPMSFATHFIRLF